MAKGITAEKITSMKAELLKIKEEAKLEVKSYDDQIKELKGKMEKAAIRHNEALNKIKLLDELNEL